MAKHTTFLLAVLFFTAPLFSQTPSLKFSTVIGSETVDIPHEIHQLPDDNFIVFGLCCGFGNYTAQVAKLSPLGALIWQKNIGGSKEDEIYAGIPTSDGGFLAAGRTYSDDGDLTGVGPVNGISDGWLLKLDANGNIEWQKLYGGGGQERFFTVAPTPSGGYIMGGTSTSGGGGLAWAVKVDANGNEIWSEFFGGLDVQLLPGNSFEDVIAAPSGGYYFAGFTAANPQPSGEPSQNYGGLDGWVVKLDEQGNLVWEQVYGGTSWEHFYAFDLAPNGDLFLTGDSWSDDIDLPGNNGNRDLWAARISPTGNLIWSKNFGGDYVDFGQGISTTTDGGMVITGQNASPFVPAGNSSNTWILKLDGNGNVEWENEFGGSSGETGYDIVQTNDDDYAVAAISFSDDGVVPENNGERDWWIFSVQNPDIPVTTDLELSLASPNIDPAIYSTTSLTATLTNTGIDAANGVVVHFPKPDGTVYQGSNQWSASQGTFIPFGPETWSVGILQPGESATLTVNYFMLTDDERTTFAEVLSQNEDDVDSSPGNGNSPFPNEDDEAALTLNGPPPPPCAITATVTNIFCDDNGTLNDATDDSFGFTLMATNDTPSSGFQLGIPELGASSSGVYDSPTVFSSINISLGSLTLDLTDNHDPSCKAIVSVNPPPPCSNGQPCNLLVVNSPSICDDNGTPNDPSDDFFFSEFTVVNPGSGSSGYSIVFGGQAFNGTYGQVLSMGPFPTDGMTIPWTITDNGDPTCTIQGGNTGQFPCSNGALPDFDLNSFFAVRPVSNGGSVVIEAGDEVVAGTVINIPSHFAWLDFPVPLPTFNVTISAYLSTDLVVDAGDVLITSGTREMNPTVQDYGFSEGQIGIGPIPASTPPGNYFIVLKYDADDLIAESDETNNTQSVAIVVTSSAGGTIDLELSLAQPNASPAIYSYYEVTATLANTGGQTATDVKVSFAKPVGVVYSGGNEYMASQGSFNPNGDEIWTVGNIPAGGSATLTVNYFLLQNTAPNAYAQVSAANETDVDSTPNNGTPPTPNEDDEASTGSAPTPLPDLVLANLDIQNSPVQAGQVLNYEFDISNIGTAAASDNFNVRAWISTDNLFGPNDFQDGIVPTGNYDPGFTVTNIPGASTIPVGLADGLYYLILKVDADDDISEGNEGNNFIIEPFTVSSMVDLPELSGQLQEFIPGQSNCYTNPGGPFGFFSIMVGNTGNAPAPAFEVRFYLSSDETLSNDDLLWSVEVVPFLDLMSVNGPAFVEPSQLIPNFVVPGDYFVLVTVDDDNDVPEINETNNNVYPISVQIGAPDLSLESYTGIPTSAVAGSSFDVEAEIMFDPNGFSFPTGSAITVQARIVSTSPFTSLGSIEILVSEFTSSNVLTKTVPATVPASLAAGDFEIQLIATGFTEVDLCETLDGDNFVNLPITITNGGGGIDLELSLVQPNASPAIYSYYEVTATLTNTGGQTATGVQVSFAKPNGVVYSGGNEYMASQGSFNPNSNQIWTVGNIPAGSSATLTVNYFLLQNEAPVAYAQVSAANETDVDSTPNNGTPPTVNEDDEASTEDGGDLCGDFTCTDAFWIGNEACPGNPVSFAVINEPGGGSGNYSYLWSDGQTDNIASNLEPGTYTVTVTDDDFGCSCVRSVTGTDYPIPFDVELSVLSQPSSPTSMNGKIQAAITSLGLTPYTYNWSNGLSYQSFDAVETLDSLSPGTYSVTVTSGAFSCENTAQIELTTGSTGDIDLAISLSASNANPQIYSNTEVTLLLTNAGPEAATGVIVEFKRPNGTVYTGGNEYSSTQGIFNPFGPETWEVGSIPAGGTATLTVSYFTLTANAITPYAQVIAANETDVDSTPGNGTCCTPNEDDEATFTLNAFAGGNNISLKAEDIEGRPVQLVAVNPNPVYHGEVMVEILSAIEGQYDLECYDLAGRLAFSQTIVLDEGRNIIPLNVARLESGTYYLNIPGQNWRNMPLRFVVARW